MQERVLLVISQVYIPDPASVGQHMADAAETIAQRGYRVVVLTSRCGYEDPSVKFAGREVRGGVEIVRLPMSSFGKKTLIHRLVGQTLFLLQVIIRGLFVRDLAGILVSTSPPMAAFAAVIVRFFRRAPITYWLMDFNPDQAIELGKLPRHSPLVTAMKWLNRRIFASAKCLVVLDRFMADRVTRQYEVRGKLVILPPWPHDDVLEDVPVAANQFRRQYNPDGRFVVMYSGNHSPSSPISTLLQAAVTMKDDPQFLFMSIGGGAGKRQVDEAIARHGLRNVISLPYQPLPQIKYSLSTADLHVVTLGSEMPGIIHPCKVYGAMAIRRPVLYIGPRPSHITDIIDRDAIGWHANHGDVDGVIGVIRAAAEMSSETRSRIGERAQAAVYSQFSKSRLCTAFCDAIERSFSPAKPGPAFVSKKQIAKTNSVPVQERHSVELTVTE